MKKTGKTASSNATKPQSSNPWQMCSIFPQRESLTWQQSRGMLAGVSARPLSSRSCPSWSPCHSSCPTSMPRETCGSSWGPLAMEPTHTWTMTWTFPPGKLRYQEPRPGSSNLHQSVLQAVLVRSRRIYILGTWSLSTPTSGCTPPRCWITVSAWLLQGSSVNKI